MYAPAHSGASRGIALQSATATTHHRPTGWFVALLVVLALLYVAWRAGRLRSLRSGIGRVRPRADLKGVRIQPLALLPALLLVVVVVILLLGH